MDLIANKYIKLPLLGLGTFSMHGERLKRVVADSLHLGYCLFDTATYYANEEELGNVLKDEGNVLIQSKVHAEQLLGNLRYLRVNKKSVRKSLSLSTQRLGRNPDIYLLHSLFDGFERHYKKLVSLREDGEVKAVGICNVSFDQLKNLKEKNGMFPDIVQVEIHPYHNNKRLIDYCIENGILIEARSPLAHGDALQEWESIDILKKISLQYNKSVPQIILRWITQQSITVIVRTTNVGHLQEDIDIFDFTLTRKELNEIDSLNRNVSYGYKSIKHK